MRGTIFSKGSVVLQRRKGQAWERGLNISPLEFSPRSIRMKRVRKSSSLDMENAKDQA